MNSQISFKLSPTIAFRQMAAWAERETYFAFYVTAIDQFEGGIGALEICEIEHSEGAFETLQAFQTQHSREICGYLGYDLKNDLEALESRNKDLIDFPEALFFAPRFWVKFENGEMLLRGDDIETLNKIKKEWIDVSLPETHSQGFGLRPDLAKADYLRAVQKLKGHLHRGDIYEVNYCIPFRGQAPSFDPLNSFMRLQEITEAPFSVFVKLDHRYILSASPERFLKKSGDKLISQPIKGTRRRGGDKVLDLYEAQQLLDDQKERSENVMIVDLVRNDLSRVARRNSVIVDRLFEIQSFKTVHHLVSTISCRIDDRFNAWDGIKACFPMGSMTGAPKIRAMQLIEEAENFKRGPYSGAFGWMGASGDFDFNVLIRTLFYDSRTGEIAMAVGSAITLGSDPEKEYAECLLKAEALLQTLQQSASHVAAQ